MIALDLSRLLSRAGRPAPTGIDRVELAYAKHLLSGDRPYGFAAMTPLGRLGRLPQAEAAEFVAATDAAWREGDAGIDRRAAARRLRRAALLGGERGLRTRLRADATRPVYLHVSHLHLDRRAFSRLRRTAGARLVCLIHDLIPLELPALTRPGQTRRHRRRLDAAAAADAVIVNSAATGAALRERLGRPASPIVVAPLGVDLPSATAPPSDAMAAYFLCLGTIEPRKNHTLLFAAWRRFVAERGPVAPRLVVVGQRGWDGDRIMRAVDESPALRGLVTERGGVPDRELARLLRGARAVLMPSWAEGFGLPAVEALAAGVPVLCSDLPALRESTGGVAEYLDPRDPIAWEAAIAAFAALDSPRRAAQLSQLAAWRAPTWEAHFALVDALLDRLTND